ncbi:MAG: aquaporin, partial [Bacteroidales bacterium]|nr:aquaporin [Bacteroidales bacterium]
LCEVIATCLLVFVILALGTGGNAFAFNGANLQTGSLGSFPVTCVIMSIGMSLGGTTGYALNPARDLSPRAAHAVLPIAGKRDSGWWYSWVPVAGPMVGAALAAVLFLLVF